jgi:hypothetical protein
VTSAVHDLPVLSRAVPPAPMHLVSCYTRHPVDMAGHRNLEPVGKEITRFRIGPPLKYNVDNSDTPLCMRLLSRVVVLPYTDYHQQGIREEEKQRNCTFCHPETSIGLLNVGRQIVG